MALLTPYPIRLDGLVIGTYAHGLDALAGLHGIPAKRDRPVEVQYVFGEVPEYDVFPRAAIRKYSIYVAGTDADGAITHPSKELGHIEENLKSLFRPLTKQGVAIAYEKDVPTLAGGVEILAGDCKCVSAVDVGGSRGLRRVDVELHFPYPYLHAPIINSNGNAGTFNIDTSASIAPIGDMIITFKSGTDQKLTVNEGPWSGQYVQWIGSPGASGVKIDVWKGTVVQLPGGTSVKGGLRHNMAAWMLWPGGDSALNMTLTGGGTVDLAYYPGRG